MDSLGVLSINLNTDANEDFVDFCFADFGVEGCGEREAADSALAWGALGMLLGAKMATATTAAKATLIARYGSAVEAPCPQMKEVLQN